MKSNQIDIHNEIQIEEKGNKQLRDILDESNIDL